MEEEGLRGVTTAQQSIATNSRLSISQPQLTTVDTHTHTRTLSVNNDEPIPVSVFTAGGLDGWKRLTTESFFLGGTLYTEGDTRCDNGQRAGREARLGGNDRFEGRCVVGCVTVVG